MGSFWPRTDRCLGLPPPAVTQPGAETRPERLRACVPSHRQDPHSQNQNRSLLGSRDHEGLIGQVSVTGPPGPRVGGDGTSRHVSGHKPQTQQLPAAPTSWKEKEPGNPDMGMAFPRSAPSLPLEPQFP